ncbi:MAG: phosphoribosylglycinamide formyltransferase [Acidobacteria bacterium]|nr:phosphoribosylglycinamide formyltransferase [Acidobacteriota bacterium]
MKQLGILISGRGSNMMAIAEAVSNGRIPDARIALVISNIETAAGLELARGRGSETLFLSHRNQTREDYDRAIAAQFQARGVDLVCLAGYMRILSPFFIRAFENRVLNIHPSLLPAFPGLDAQQQALEYGVKFTGCTVHLVDEKMDHGPIVKQAVVPVLPDDNLDSLSRRILVEEHKLYPEAISLIIGGKYRIEGRRIKEE